MKTKIIERKILHFDGKTIVTARGKIINNEFIGEYKFEKMTYGVTIKL